VNRVLVAFQRRSGWNVPWRLPRVRWDELIGLARRGQRARTVRVGASWGTFRWPTGPIPRRTRRRLLACTRRSRRSGRRGSVSPLAHLAATSGTVTDPATHFGMVRVGAGLVGIDPSRTVEMHGASRLTAPIVPRTAVEAGPRSPQPVRVDGQSRRCVPSRTRRWSARACAPERSAWTSGRPSSWRRPSGSAPPPADWWRRQRSPISSSRRMWVVKPASAGSSFGVALPRDASQPRDALRWAARFDDRILIEDVVPGPRDRCGGPA
jgi:hypothetical protein